jgi:hypothetical protein
MAKPFFKVRRLSPWAAKRKPGLSPFIIKQKMNPLYSANEKEKQDIEDFR